MYKIVFTRAGAKEYDRLETRIQDQIDTKLASLARGEFHLLHIDKIEGREQTFRVRSGGYRILYEKEDDILIITVIKIGHRKDVYRKF